MRSLAADTTVLIFLTLLDPVDLFFGDEVDSDLTWTTSNAHIEHAFLAVPTNASIRATSFEFTSAPHIAGSDRDLETAKITLRHWRDYLGLVKSKEAEEPLDAGSYESMDALYSKRPSPRVWIDTCACYAFAFDPCELELGSDSLGRPSRASLTHRPRPAELAARQVVPRASRRRWLDRVQGQAR